MEVDFVFIWISQSCKYNWCTDTPDIILLSECKWVNTTSEYKSRNWVKLSLQKSESHSNEDLIPTSLSCFVNAWSFTSWYFLVHVVSFVCLFVFVHLSATNSLNLKRVNLLSRQKSDTFCSKEWHFLFKRVTFSVQKSEISLSQRCYCIKNFTDAIDISGLKHGRVRRCCFEVC